MLNRRSVGHNPGRQQRPQKETYGEDTAVKEVLARREQRSGVGVLERAEEALAAAKVRYPGGDANPSAFSPRTAGPTGMFQHRTRRGDV